MTDRSVPIRAAVQLYVFLSGVLLGAPTALLPPARRGDGPQPSRFHFFPVSLCGTLVPISAGRMKFAVLCCALGVEERSRYPYPFQKPDGNSQFTRGILWAELEGVQRD